MRRRIVDMDGGGGKVELRVSPTAAELQPNIDSPSFSEGLGFKAIPTLHGLW